MADDKWADLVIQEIQQLGANLNKMDRKIEIKHKQTDDKIEEMRKCFGSEFGKHKTEHIECKRDCTAQTDKKLSSKIYMWVTGFIILAILGLSGFTSSNKVAIEHTETSLENHIRPEVHQEKK
jgi:hypothetical protein